MDPFLSMSWTGEDSSDKDRSFAAIIGFDAVLYFYR